MRQTKDLRFRPFLREVSLLPGESLPSLLTRLTAANFYDPPNLVTKFYTDQLADMGIYDQLDCPICPETFELLALLTGLSPDQLANATHHYFAPTMNLREPQSTITLPDGQALELIHKYLRDDFRLQNNLQYCPLCLSQAAYHRLAWYPRAVAVCLEHQCFLLEKCWRCSKRLSMRMLVERQCTNCEADLTSANPIPVKDDPYGWFVQESIYSWLGLPSSALASELGLPNQPSRILFQMLYGLCSSLETRMDWNYIHWPGSFLRGIELPRKLTKRGMKPVFSYMLYATAFKGLVDWPHGFHDFLTQYLAYTQQPRKRQNGVDLGMLAYHWLGYQWRVPEFKFVQEAYDQFLQLVEEGLIILSYRTPSRSEFAVRFEYVSVEHAASLLGTTEDIVYRLIRSGKISTIKAASHSTIWLKQADVTELWNKGNDEIPLSVRGKFPLGETKPLNRPDIDRAKPYRFEIVPDF